MGKKLFLVFLMGLIGLSQILYAEDSSGLEKNVYKTGESYSTKMSKNQKVTSNATIGFSSKSTKNNIKGRLPTTGESAGIGISLFGLMLIIIIFRNELKEMIKNKKIEGDERK